MLIIVEIINVLGRIAQCRITMSTSINDTGK